MNVPRVVHVIHHGSPIPDIVHERDRVFTYGQGTSGIIDHVIVHDAPRDDRDHEWLNTCVLVRISPAGTMHWMLRD